MVTTIGDLYGEKNNRNLECQILRFEKVRNGYVDKFGSVPSYMFSSPGRTELCGNHTDHNGGKVLAAAVNPDMIAAVGKGEDLYVKLFSDIYDEVISVNLSNLDKVEKERETSAGIIRGILKGFVDHGYRIGGFSAYVSSAIPIGSGLSTSASFEILVCEILNQIYNDGKIPPRELAIIGKYAENEYFGKPCGLMDQLTIAEGGVVYIDFKNEENPEVRKLNYSFSEKGYALLVVDTGHSHADLTNEYASIPGEMREIAKLFGVDKLREICESDVLEKIEVIRNKAGDRALLRSLHFFSENDRVDRIMKAIGKDDFEAYLDIVQESGNSSFKYLQNCYSASNPHMQSISLALFLTEKFIREEGLRGTCRVHGGGFAGTIQVYIPIEAVEEYKNFIGKYFGRDSVIPIEIRKDGVVILNR
ncbi:MAG: galactokinase [Candidatus Neomarinimicrobiota bacterium]|nr:galactokinase [Candidatus Neomarinimicrobiota bacterium]RKY50279.1 MAG: galactokinase [Candidatus Neomarinimicrobiota bacterium]